MRFGKVFSLAAAILALSLCHEASAAGDGRFFLIDQRTQTPVMCCTMPQNWLIGGKTTWSTDMANPVHWYVWAMRPDRRVKIIISSQTVLGSPGAIPQVRMLQDPRVLAQMMLETVKKDHGFTEIAITDAKFLPFQITQQLREARLRQAAERGIRLTNLIPAELVIRYDGKCGSEPRVAFVSLPMLVSESQASAMSRTTTIELLTPSSYSAPEAESESVKSTLAEIIKSLQMNRQFIQIINHIVSRRVEERIRVQNEIRDQQFELARSTSATQDRVRDMWSEYIRGVDSVSNPNTGEQMFLDRRYDHAWIDNNGEVIYQNSGPGSFDPNTDQSFNRTQWRQLK